LDPSRNPQLGKEGIEKLLKEYLGIDKVIWLWKGMAGETSRPAMQGVGAGGSSSVQSAHRVEGV
jgi:hypothetical protein